MANTQKLSPQGYNIQDAPTNSNPFWDQEGGGGGGGGDITIDDALSLTSRNPVENRVITQALTEIEDSIPDVSEISSRLTAAEAEISDIKVKDTSQDSLISAQGERITTAESDIDALETGKQNKLTAGANITIIDDVISATGGGGGGYTFDPVPTQGSTNPVYSGGVYTAISDAKSEAISTAEEYTDGIAATKQDTLTFDTTPTYGSTNPVTSSGVRGADVYHLQLAKDYADGIGDTKQNKWQSLGTFAFDGEITTEVTKPRLSLNNLSVLKTAGLHVLTLRPVSIGEYTVPDNLAPVLAVMFYVPQSMQNTFTNSSVLSGMGSGDFILTNGNEFIELYVTAMRVEKETENWALKITCNFENEPSSIESRILYAELGHMVLS